MKTWNWKSLEAYLELLCCLCVPRLLQEQEHNEYIGENLKQEIRVSNTPFQETKLGSVISSTVPSSLHSRNIFSLILVVGPNGHN
jgi:hypothetical protein